MTTEGIVSYKFEIQSGGTVSVYDPETDHFDIPYIPKDCRLKVIGMRKKHTVADRECDREELESKELFSVFVWRSDEPVDDDAREKLSVNVEGPFRWAVIKQAEHIRELRLCYFAVDWVNRAMCFNILWHDLPVEIEEIKYQHIFIDFSDSAADKYTKKLTSTKHNVCC